MVVSDQWASSLGPDRAGRSRAGIEDARRRLDEWFAGRVDDPRLGRFQNHLAVLRQVLTRMLDAVAATIPDAGATGGQVYDLCRRADAQVALAVRLHSWYAAKYDQRADPRLERVLLAADEVVRSCWTQPFVAAGNDPPTGPLAYLEPRYDAYATPRVSVPADLRAPEDAVVGQFVNELPIPVLALPELAGREPWWLVLAAHETGHHVQRDLAPQMVGATRSALLAVTEPAIERLEAAGEDVEPDLSPAWQRWSVEAFADAFAALSVGSAASWAVEELQYGAVSRLTAAPRTGDRYPPPVVRTALIGELAALAGDARPGLGAAEVRAWLDALPGGTVKPLVLAVLRQHLALTPHVARALVDLRVRDRSMAELCGWSGARFAADGDMSGWVAVLAGEPAGTTRRTRREAARLAVAASVRTYLDTAGPDAGGLAGLREVVLDLLPICGPAGQLAGGQEPDAGALADRLAQRLLAVDPDVDDEIDGGGP